MESEKVEIDNKVDIYRDTPLRFLGYANELVEALRPVIHKYILRGGYGVATVYMFADVADKTFDKAKEDPNKMAWIQTAADVGIWQSLASLIIPSVFINRFGAGARYVFKKTTELPKPLATRISVIMSLATIPFIVKPIDHSVDYIMDHTVRDLLGTNKKA